MRAGARTALALRRLAVEHSSPVLALDAACLAESIASRPTDADSCRVCRVVAVRHVAELLARVASEDCETIDRDGAVEVGRKAEDLEAVATVALWLLRDLRRSVPPRESD